MSKGKPCHQAFATVQSRHYTGKDANKPAALKELGQSAGHHPRQHQTQ